MLGLQQKLYELNVIALPVKVACDTENLMSARRNVSWSASDRLFVFK